MSQENVEVVRRAAEAFSGRDNESVFRLPRGRDRVRDGRPRYRGLDGVRDFFRDWLGVWGGFGEEVEEWIDADEHVIAILHSWGRRKQSGIVVEQRWAHVWKLRNGKLWRLRVYATKAEALEAVGLSE